MQLYSLCMPISLQNLVSVMQFQLSSSPRQTHTLQKRMHIIGNILTYSRFPPDRPIDHDNFASPTFIQSLAVSHLLPANDDGDDGRTYLLLVPSPHRDQLSSHTANEHTILAQFFNQLKGRPDGTGLRARILLRALLREHYNTNQFPTPIETSNLPESGVYGTRLFPFPPSSSAFLPSYSTYRATCVVGGRKYE